MNSTQTLTKSDQTRWQRIVLLIVLAYEALGCLLGGGLLMMAPDGRLMDMPVELMHGTFRNFLIPGCILFGLGILNTIAFGKVLSRGKTEWIMSWLALGGLSIWFWVEIAIILELHWLHAMWGLPVVLGGIVAVPLLPRESVSKMLLVCGALSSLLYFVINIIVPAQWADYSVVSQTVSELSAVDAPTRFLRVVLSAPYSLLVVAFAAGICRSAGGNRGLVATGRLMIVYGGLGLLWPFAPMHLRETLSAGGGTVTDTLHIALGVITEVTYLAMLIITMLSLGKGFRIYSVLTLVLLIIFGMLTFREAPDIALNRPTPQIGLWERLNIGVFLLWMIVLSLKLLQRNTKLT